MSLLRVVGRCSLLCGIFLFNLHFQTANAQAQVPARVVDAVNDANRVTLRGNVHPLARAEFDRGAVVDSQPMNRMLLLLKRGDGQETALQAMLQNQQDKSSGSFHQWLTPEQFGTQFGPADADIQAVTDWLTRQGFSIGKVYSGKTVIEFSGTAGQVQRAFGTAIHNYVVNGKTYSANVSDPEIPAALAPVVAGVVSLHNFPRQFYARRFGSVQIAAGKSTVTPLVTMPNPFGSGNFYGLGPGDFAKIYGSAGLIQAGNNGSGQTIAIVGETNLQVSDVQKFRSTFGLSANFSTNNIIYNGEDPGITSTDEEGEALLDTQWSGAVAPGATIKFVLSASTSASQGVDLSALYIVEHNVAGIMSESYGECESSLGSTGNSFFNSLWEQASAQGITVAISSGDNGSAACDDPNQEGLATHAPAVNGLGSTPYNVSVGGTDFDEYNNWTPYWSATNNATTGTSALGYIPEIPWNQSCAQLGASGCNINTTAGELQNIVAGSGGPSGKYSKPSWQMGTAGMPADNKRDLPDISLFASPGFNGTGYLYCQTDIPGAYSGCVIIPSENYVSFGVIGGTSASAPAFAGVMALVNQKQATAQNPAPRQGNADYVLYALANKTGTSCTSSATETAGCVFNDVVAGSSALPTGGTGKGTNSVPCTGRTLDCSSTVSGGIGVLDDPNNPGKLAWLTTAGYDLVTGLGSLNIGNLVTSWANVSSVPTSTTLTLSPTTGIAHGAENVTATIGVTPSSGTASGTVSLIAKMADGTTLGAGQFTLGANGSVTGTALNLPGGTNYQVHAHYSGDGTNAPSDSRSVTVSVSQESSKTFIVVPTFDAISGNQTNANATSVMYGTPYIIRMYVTNSAGASTPTGAPTGTCTQSSKVSCPSGTVALTANGNDVDGGTFNLDSIGYTRDISPTLSGGTYSLGASYGGDTSYQPSAATDSFTVNPAATTLGPLEIYSTLIVGASADMSMLLSTQAYTGVAPTGTITLYDGGTAITGYTNITNAPPSNGGTASLTEQFFPTFTTSGKHVITAKYSGDANYAPATNSSGINISVVYATTLSTSVSSTNITYGQSITLSATITSQSKNPPMTGQVQFFGSGSVFSNITTTPGTDASGNQMMTATATVTPVGSNSYSISYPGDSNYESASSFSPYVNVNTPDFTMTPANGLTLVPVAGQAGSTQITITPMSQTASSVTLTMGQFNIEGYTISLAPQQLQLNGSPVTATLTMTPTGASPASAIRKGVRHAGIFSVARGEWWTISLAAGFAVVFLMGLPGRRNRIRSAFGLGLVCLMCFSLGCGGGGGGSSPGGGGNGGGGGGIGQHTTSVALTTSNPKVSNNDPLTIIATVSGGPAISGTLTFYDYGIAITNSLPVSTSQPQVEIGTSNLILGVHQLTVKYSGDANNLPSTSPSISQTITGSFPISIQGQTGVVYHAVDVTIGLQ